MRKKVFCWWPTEVYKVNFWRSGFRWFSFAWLDEDGKFYETKEELNIDIDELITGKPNKATKG